MAEAYFRHLCKQNRLDQDVTCESAGIKANVIAVVEKNLEEGETPEVVVAPEPVVSPIPEEAQELMIALGLTLENHKPQQVTAELISEADAVICMTREQRAFVTENFKEESAEEGKVRLLLSFLDSEDDIDDPQRGDMETFEQCFLSMMPALAALTDRIMRSAK
jgi:protein-tyrosine-phosphatase